MSTASRGRALEHEVRELFRAAGWSVVRGAGSKGEFDFGDDQPMKVDLIASKVTKTNERTAYIVGLQMKLKRRSERHHARVLLTQDASLDIG